MILVCGMLGWTVTYIIQDRGGGPSAGYISSGFFGGMCSDKANNPVDQTDKFRSHSWPGRTSMGKSKGMSEIQCILLVSCFSGGRETGAPNIWPPGNRVSF